VTNGKWFQSSKCHVQQTFTSHCPYDSYWLHCGQHSQSTREIKALSPVGSYGQISLHWWYSCWWFVLLPPLWGEEWQENSCFSALKHEQEFLWLVGVSLPFRFFNQNTACISHLAHVCYMFLPSHPPRFDHPHTKLLIMQSSPASSFSFLLGPNILLSSLFSDTFNLCSSLSVRDQVSHPYKMTGKVMILYTLIFKL